MSSSDIINNPYQMSLEDYNKVKYKLKYPNKLENFKIHKICEKEDVKIKMT